MSFTVHGIQRYTLLTFTLLMVFCLTSSSPFSIQAQETEPSGPSELVVEEIFNTLSPNERVGQLFLVSFRGDDISPTSEIAQLIQNYHIGGVEISATHQNFTNARNAPAQILRLTNDLQALTAAPVEPASTTPQTLPLFIAITHEGDGLPYSQIRNGAPHLPNQMALGATWNPEYARLVGEFMGQQLSLLGVNMLLGPSLDVLDDPRPELSGSLGTRTFGGHPHWVAEMGQAYIQGVHQGSNQEVLTIAKHFPGFGSSDRPLNQDVPTILKSLEDLQQNELVPFFRVTQVENLETPEAWLGITDGLLTTHVRYRGLRGNVLLSLDAQNLPHILAQKEFTDWHSRGGLIVSAPLGVPAALEGITPRENFPARRLAQDAHLAGNDILFLRDFAFEGSEATEEIANIKNAIDFFREQYQNEPNFQNAVDIIVKRIIRAKIKIFGENLAEAEIQKPLANLRILNDLTIDLDQIAQAGATLITPLTEDTASPLPGSPQPDDQILIFTDNRLGQDCPTCPPEPLIETTQLQRIILGLFGPDATGQIESQQIRSLEFAALKDITTEEISNRSRRTELLIEEATWIIFVMLDIDTEVYPNSDAVRAVLRNRQDILRNKTLVLFTFNAPYFLGETEISQLTAYYCFYSKGQVYLENAARLLFQQFKPAGSSPVSIPAFGPLDLSPDPTQTIQLEPIHKVDSNGNIIPIEESASFLTRLDLKVGEGIHFRTSVIMDKNGHPVPDGTSVLFFRNYPQEGLSLEPLMESTVDGVAEITIYKQLDSPLQVRASSDLAAQSVPFDIGPGVVDTPTPTPTNSPTPTNTPTSTNTSTPTSTPELITPTIPLSASLQATPSSPPTSTNIPSRPVNFIDLAYSLLGIMLISGIAFALGGDRFSLEERVRPALVAVAFGLVGYICYTIAAIMLPKTGYFGSIVQRGAVGHWVAPLVSLLCAITSMGAWYLKPGRIFGKKKES